MCFYAKAPKANRGCLIALIIHRVIIRLAGWVLKRIAPTSVVENRIVSITQYVVVSGLSSLFYTIGHKITDRNHSVYLVVGVGRHRITRDI